MIIRLQSTGCWLGMIIITLVITLRIPQMSELFTLEKTIPIIKHLCVRLPVMICPCVVLIWQLDHISVHRRRQQTQSMNNGYLVVAHIPVLLLPLRQCNTNEFISMRPILIVIINVYWFNSYLQYLLDKSYYYAIY